MVLPSLEEIKAELARRQLIRFTTYTKPNYLAGWFHHSLAATLDQFLEDVVMERSPRLMIMAPPRHGKTELTSRRFPAFALGKYPNLSFIGTSYSSDLASSINRDVQRIICSDEYRQLFPDTRLWGSNVRTVADESYLRNSDIFEIVGHDGVYKSAGRGAGIGGRGGHILLIDDPVKDAAEAHSKTIRDGTWEWYTSTLYTRGMPGAGILLIMTRWHEDDLAGRILASMAKGGEQWKIIRFPAIAEEDEQFRKMGDPLHAERYSLDMLNNIRIGTADDPGGVGSKVWTSLYQQRPSAAEGNIFKRENWKWWKPLQNLNTLDEDDLKRMCRQMEITKITQHWDVAIGGKEESDYNACTTIGHSKNRYCVLNVWHKQCEFPEVKRQMVLLNDKWRPRKVTVEGGGATGGKAAIQDLRRDTIIPFVETKTSQDKVFRANLISPTHEAGLCYLPEGEVWVSDFVENCSNFPNAAHDDDVDSFIMAMEDATQGSREMKISDDFLARIS